MQSKHKKPKKLLTRIASTILTLAVALTSINLQPLTVHAIEGDNGNLTTIQGNISTYPYGFNDKRQGYRFYVIENTGSTPKVVSKVVDFVYSTPNVKDNHWYTNPRWYPLSTDGSNYECRSIYELRDDFCEGAIPNSQGLDITNTSMVPVQIKTATLVGSKFQLWFLGEAGRDLGGTAPSTNPSTGNSTNNKNGELTNTNQDPPEEEEEKEEIIDSPDDFLTSGKYTESQISAYREQVSSGEAILKKFSSANEAAEFINDDRYSNFETALKDSSDIQKLIDTYKSGVEICTEGLNWSEHLAKLNNMGIIQSRALKLGFDYRTSQAIAYLIYSKSYDAILSGKTISTDNLLDTNIPLSDDLNNISLTEIDNESTLKALEDAGINIDKLSDCLDIQIPLAEKTEKNHPADKFVTFIPKDGSPSIFNVKGFNTDVTGDGTITLLDAIKYKDANGNYLYGLVVEPLMWAGMYKDSKTYEPWYTLGTYYNIVQYYVEVLNNTRGSGAHYSYLSLHGKNCMVVSQNVNDFGSGSFKLKAATDSSRMSLGGNNGNKGILDLMNDGYGYGMHFYYRGHFEDTDSKTSTYDESLGSAIGPSEDCTNLPEETSYSQASKKVNIVKHYITIKADGSEQIDGTFIRTNTPHVIDIENEIEYSVSEWETSQEKTTIMTESLNGTKNYNYQQLIQNSTKNQSGTTENTVTLSENEYTLYVKLVRQETPPPVNNRQTGQFILHESEIARAVNTSGGIDATKIDIKLKFNIPDINIKCNGHKHKHQRTGYDDSNGNGVQDNGESDTYHYGAHTHSNEKMNHNSTYELAVKNELESSAESKNIIAQNDKAKFNSYIEINSLVRASANAENNKETKNYVYNFTIYRYMKGEENLSLCSYNQKQSSNKDNVSISDTNKNTIKILGYSEKTTKSTKNRAESDYVQTVNLKFVYDKANSPVTNIENKFPDINCSYGNITGEHKDGEILVAYEPDVTSDISVQVYSGQPNKALHNKLWTETIGRNGEKYLPIRDNNNKTVGRQVQLTDTVKFSPFIRMTYSTVEDLKNNTIKKYPVNVLSEYQREILNTDYAEVAWNYQKDTANLSLLSNQWSVDEVLTNGTDSWKKPNQVLKGGASAALQIKDSDMREITLRTYQTVFPDSDISTYLINANNYSVDKAVQEHDKFIQSAVDTFEQLHIVQRVSKNIEDSIDDMADENKVERGGNISFLNNNSNTSSSDSKYYLSKDLSGLNAGADEGDLDVKLGNTTKKFFKVWSDTSGNILITEGTDINALKDNINGTVILTKNQDSNSLTNQTAIDLNNRTFIVDKLINAVERNTGNDSSADWASSDGKWYNEAMAVYCMVSTTSIKLGFRDVSTRAFVLDTKLIPYLSSKSEQGKTAYTSIFSTDSYSEKWGSSEKGKVAVFKGQSIYMEDMQRLFTSKLFYIPNMTVQGSR